MRNPLDGIKTETKKIQENIDLSVVFGREEYKAVPKELRKKLLDCLDKDTHSPFLKPMCYLMYFTGNRVGETIPYQWKDFDFKQRYFVVHKTVTIEYEFDEMGNVVGQGKTVIKTPKSKSGYRPLPLFDILYEVMWEWYERCKALEKVKGISLTAPDDYVFATDSGQMRTEGGTYSIFRRFLKRYDLQGKGIHFHALRQTFSNSLFANGSDEQVIEDLMGHADIAVTKKYYKSIQKFDSVQSVAKQFNRIYKPKNKKYEAGEDVLFAPEGYVSEEEAIIMSARKQTKDEKPKELGDVLKDLKTLSPELFEVLKNAMM